MIYICKSCGLACDSCGKACDGCGKAFSACCAELGHCCDPLNRVMERPLGGYVLFSWFFCIPAGLCGAYAALGDEAVSDCEEKPLSVASGANFLLCVLHSLFGLYLQWRLVEGIDQQRRELVQQDPSKANAEPTSKELMSKAGEIVLYDVGFCLYFFVFAFSLVFQFMIFSWMGDCEQSSGALYSSAVLLVMFGMLATCFSCCWWSALTCDDCCCSPFRTPPGQASPQGRTAYRSPLEKIICGSGKAAPQAQQQGVVYGSPVAQQVVMGQPQQPPQPHQQQQQQKQQPQQHPTPQQQQQQQQQVPPQQQQFVTSSPLASQQINRASGSAPAPQPVQQQVQQQQPQQPQQPPPPQQQPQEVPAQKPAEGKSGMAKASELAGGGLLMAGKGMQKAGEWFGGKKSKNGTE